jgi:hypothetical protein
MEGQMFVPGVSFLVQFWEAAKAGGGNLITGLFHRIIGSAPPPQAILASWHIDKSDGEYNRIRTASGRLSGASESEIPFTLDDLYQPMTTPPPPTYASIERVLYSTSLALGPAHLTKTPFVDLTPLDSSSFSELLGMREGIFRTRLQPLVDYLNFVKAMAHRSAFHQIGYDLARLVLGILKEIPDEDREPYLNLLVGFGTTLTPISFLDTTLRTLDKLLDDSLLSDSGDFQKIYELRIRFACLRLRWEIFTQTYEEVRPSLGSSLELQTLLLIGFFPIGLSPDSGTHQNNLDEEMIPVWNDPAFKNIRARMYLKYQERLRSVFPPSQRSSYTKWLGSFIQHLSEKERVLDLIRTLSEHEIPASFQNLLLFHLGILDETPDWVRV